MAIDVRETLKASRVKLYIISHSQNTLLLETGFSWVRHRKNIEVLDNAHAAILGVDYEFGNTITHKLYIEATTSDFQDVTIQKKWESIFSQKILSLFPFCEEAYFAFKGEKMIVSKRDIVLKVKAKYNNM